MTGDGGSKAGSGSDGRGDTPAGGQGSSGGEASASRKERSSSRIKAVEARDSQSRKRAKLTLRIPDDEVARPTPPMLLAASVVEGASLEPAAGIDATEEPGWTPFQPEVNGTPAEATEVRAPISSIEVHLDADLYAADLSADVHDDRATLPSLPRGLESDEDPVGSSERHEGASRAGEVGEFEVGIEDLVIVEALPTAHGPRPAPPSSGPAVLGAQSSGPSLASTEAAVATPLAARRPIPSQPGHGAARTAARSLAPPPVTESSPPRKRVRPWWEDLFNDDFLRTMARVTDAQIAEEVSFIEESLSCEPGAMILDLACGTGRHAVELAARGYQVVGFDLSLSMLARASEEAQERRQKINFIQGDMREMAFEETFDGVYSWSTSFGYFDEEKNGAVIARVHRALKKGGQLLLDVVNRDYVARQAPSLAWFEGDGCVCMDEMTFDFITSRMKIKRTLMLDDGRTKEIEYSIRAYSLHELGKMLHDNGFRVAEVSGRVSTPGVFFGSESPRTLILAEKR